MSSGMIAFVPRELFGGNICQHVLGTSTGNSVMAGPKLMQEIEIRYQERSGLRDRNSYTIYYSQICPSDVLVLGTNPGGSPNDPSSIICASTRYYENWEHEYVDSHYPIQVVMNPLLKNVLGVNDTQYAPYRSRTSYSDARPMKIELHRSTEYPRVKPIGKPHRQFGK